MVKRFFDGILGRASTDPTWWDLTAALAAYLDVGVRATNHRRQFLKTSSSLCRLTSSTIPAGPHRETVPADRRGCWNLYHEPVVSGSSSRSRAENARTAFKANIEAFQGSTGYCWAGSDRRSRAEVARAARTNQTP